MAELKASIKISAEDRSSAALDKVAAGSKKLEERLAGMRGELAALERKDSSIKKFRALKAELGRTGPALDRAKARTAELGRQMKAAEAPTARLRKEFEASRKKSKGLADSHRKQREQLHSLRSELRKAGVDTRSLGDAQRRIRVDLDRSARGMERMGRAAMRIPAAQARLDRATQGLTAAGVLSGELNRIGGQLVRAGLAPVRAMRAVERSKGDLRSLGMSRQEVDLVARRGRGLSRRVAGVNTPEFIAAAYDIRSGVSGLDAAGVARYAELASLTAAATRADPGQMTSLFATAYGSFKESLFEGLSDIEFGEVFAAQMAKSVEAFKTDGSKMQQAIESMGSGLSEAGVSLGQQLAALGMLQQKMAPGRAGTALAAVERTAADAQDRFRQMGLGARVLDADGNMRSPAELLDEMERVFGKEYTSRIGSQIQKAFGSEEAVQFFKALWGRAEDLETASRAQVAAAERRAEVVETMAARRQENLDSQFQVIEQKWGELLGALGDTMGPQAEWAAEWVSGKMDQAEDFAGRHPEASAAGITALIAGGVGASALGAAGLAKWAIRKSWAELGLKGLLEKASGGPGAGPPGRGVFDGGYWRDLARGKGWRSLPGRAWESLRGLPKLAKAGTAIGAGLTAVDIFDAATDKDLSGKQKADEIITGTGAFASGIAGTLGGAKLGALLGAFTGPLAPAAVPVGAFLGGAGAYFLGENLFGRIIDSDPGPRWGPDEKYMFAQGAAPAPLPEMMIPWHPEGPPGPGGLPPAEALLLPGIAELRREQRAALAVSGDRTLQITNTVIVERRPGEDPEELGGKIADELERRQALAGREVLGDAY